MRRALPPNGSCSLHSAQSITRFVESLVGRPEQGEDLLMQRRQPQDERGGGRIGTVPDVQQLDALETLEDLTHGRPIRLFRSGGRWRWGNIWGQVNLRSV